MKQTLTIALLVAVVPVHHTSAMQDHDDENPEVIRQVVNEVPPTLAVAPPRLLVPSRVYPAPGRSPVHREAPRTSVHPAPARPPIPADDSPPPPLRTAHGQLTAIHSSRAIPLAWAQPVPGTPVARVDQARRLSVDETKMALSHLSRDLKETLVASQNALNAFKEKQMPIMKRWFILMGAEICTGFILTFGCLAVQGYYYNQIPACIPVPCEPLS